MKALILQNCETEDLGLYVDVLTELGLRHHVVRAYREPIPAGMDYDILMIGGMPDAARGYARAYADELPEVGKKAEEVMAECRAREGEKRELAGRLLANFMRMSHGSA